MGMESGQVARCLICGVPTILKTVTDLEGIKWDILCETCEREHGRGSLRIGRP